MSSLSNLADNLADGILEIKHKDCHCFLEYESVNNNLIKYECLSCNKNNSNKMEQELKNTLDLSNNDVNKFILLLRESVYPYKCKDERDKLIKHCLRKKTFIVT